MKSTVPKRRKERYSCSRVTEAQVSLSLFLVIHFTRDITTQIPRGFQPSIAKTSTPFPYKSDKAVPWKYGVQCRDERKNASVIRVGRGMPTAKITNISSTSGMTHSGHIFSPSELPARSKDKGKAKADMGEREKMGLTANDEAPVGKFAEEGDARGRYRLRRQLNL